jgi:hypothetical protein
VAGHFLYRPSYDTRKKRVVSRHQEGRIGKRCQGRPYLESKAEGKKEIERVSVR